MSCRSAQGRFFLRRTRTSGQPTAPDTAQPLSTQAQVSEPHCDSDFRKLTEALSSFDLKLDLSQLAPNSLELVRLKVVDANLLAGQHKLDEAKQLLRQAVRDALARQRRADNPATRTVLAVPAPAEDASLPDASIASAPTTATDSQTTPTGSSAIAAAPTTTPPNLQATVVPHTNQKPRAFGNAIHEEDGGSGSCWVNAALQALFAPSRCKEALAHMWSCTLPQHRERLLQKALDDRVRKAQIPTPAEVPTAARLAATFAAAFTPPLTKPLLPHLCLDQYYTGDQDDAAELLVRLVDADTSLPLSKLFEGRVTQTLTCANEGCQRCRDSAADTYNQLMLPLVPPDGNRAHLRRSVQEALDAHDQPVLVQDVNPGCDACGGHTFWKREEVTAFPGVLMVSLNRWNNAGAALLHPVEATQELSYQSQTYHLKSVVVHTGASAHSGHYWCVSKHPTPTGDWWMCNDADRRIATQKQVATLGTHRSQSQQSYVLFYER